MPIESFRKIIVIKLNSGLFFGNLSRQGFQDPYHDL